MIYTEFVVYGENVEEIQTRAAMVARRFFGVLEPRFSYNVGQMKGPANLWEAQVTASWEPAEP